MITSPITPSHAHSDSSALASDKFRDSASPGHSTSVTPISERAVNDTPAAEKPSSKNQSSPSAVYIRSEHHEQSSYSLGSVVTAGKVDNEKSSSDKAAGNILTFIENRLRADLADGATQEQLASRIEAGLSGFLEGFGQASGELKDAGLLEGSLSGEIQQTHDKVLAGIEALKKEFLEGEKGPRKEVGTEPEQVSSPSVDFPKESARATSLYGFSESSLENSFSFSVVTRDGDKVTINTSSLETLLQEGFLQQGGRSTSNYYSSSHSQSNTFELMVDGHLDKGEMSALTDLLSQVNDLSEQFFSGDLESAFTEALSLGYDSTEISAFSLNLSQTVVQRTATAYQHNGGQGSLAESLQPLGSFVKGLLESIKMAENFQYPQQLISDIAGQFDKQNSATDFKPFVERLLDTLPS